MLTRSSPFTPFRMPLFRPWAPRPLLVAALLLGAPLAAAAQLKPPRVPDAGLPWRAGWNSAEDSATAALTETRQVVISGPLAVTLDDGTREVYGLELETGRPRFVLRPRGSGPGEFQRPLSIIPTPTGFAVWDIATNRLSAYTRQGTLAWDTPLPVGGNLVGMCVTPGPRIHVVLRQRDSSVLTFDTAGRSLGVRSVPWRTLPPKLPGFAYQGALTGDGGSGACAMAPLFGGEWAVIPDAGPIRTHALVTPGKPPAVKTTVISREVTGLNSLRIRERQESKVPAVSAGVAMLGDTAFILAAEVTGYYRRVVDVYHLPTGRYVESRILPFLASGLAVGPQGRHVVSYLRDEQVGIAMLKRVPPPPGRQPSSARRPSRK